MEAINRQPRRLVAAESNEAMEKPSEYVFTTSTGKPQSHRNWRRQWDAWLVAAFGAEPQEDKTKAKKPLITVTPHALRHMQAVHLIRQGWSVADVQQRGGWDSPKVLMEIYANHSSKNRQEQMAEAARIKRPSELVAKKPTSVKTSVK